MNTAIINIRTDSKVKSQAQKVAKKMGLSLSDLLNIYLRKVVKYKKITVDAGEEPSKYLLNAIKRARENRRKGKGSPLFRTGKEAVSWLEKQGI